MIGFKEYNESIAQKQMTETIQDKIALLTYIVENDKMLNESYDIENLTEAQEVLIVEGVNGWLGKIGMKLHKGDGIISYIKQFVGGAGKLILAAIKGDKEEVKKIASSLEKAEVVDFLLKLDMVTLHLLSAPIHFIHGITGWDLEADLKHMVKGTKGVIDTVKKAFSTIKNNIKYLFGDNTEGLNAVNNLELALIPTK